MTWYKPQSTLDKVFAGGILIKGATGALEFLAGLLLFFVPPSAIEGFIMAITQRERLEDPHDGVVNLLMSTTHELTSGGQVFLIVYLWIHALIKLIAVIGILRNQMWAYPFSLITLGLLMLYQVYSIIFVRPSIGMILLTVFDVFVLWLIAREYRILRSTRGAT